MELQKKIIIIDFCNYEDYPIGGYLSFAKNLMSSFGNDLALVGITNDKRDPIGKWFKKQINGVVHDYFAFAFYSQKVTKHYIPDRLAGYFYVRYFRQKIFRLGIKNIFVQRQEILYALSNTEDKNFCYCFAGLENPLGVSKYWYAKYIADYFEKLFFKSLLTVQLILASGDEVAIREMIIRSKGVIKPESVIQFPSRVNTEIFYPIHKDEARKNLNIPKSIQMVTTTGRISWLKGWKFMIDSFLLFETENPDSRFYVIGEGEDFQKMKEYIELNKMDDKIILAGKQDAKGVALYLNAADLFIMGSYKEGWSTALIEAIACGTPACVTNFSSAKSIILEGENGFVVEKHDEPLFSESMQKAIRIKPPIFTENINGYAANKLKEELLKKWELI